MVLELPVPEITGSLLKTTNLWALPGLYLIGLCGGGGTGIYHFNKLPSLFTEHTQVDEPLACMMTVAVELGRIK